MKIFFKFNIQNCNNLNKLISNKLLQILIKKFKKNLYEKNKKFTNK